MYLCVDYHLYRQLSIFNTHLSTLLKKCLNDDYYSENLCTEDVLGRNRAFQAPSPEEILMVKECNEAIAKVYEELGPIKTEILQRYTGVDYDKPQSKRRIGQEMGLSKSCVNTLLNEALEYAKEHLRVYYY